jgi:hypothetical protein
MVVVDFHFTQRCKESKSQGKFTRPWMKLIIQSSHCRVNYDADRIQSPGEPAMSV